jgi:acetylornithine deacetylase/succinyl-diaminopimelate desuccinylase-like protein
VHASVPASGVNPLHVVARFIMGLERVERGSHPDLGESSVAPTLLRTDQTSANVVPGEAWLTCDWRNVPGESGEDVRRRLQALADASLLSGASATVELPRYDERSYTGFTRPYVSFFPPFVLPAAHPALQAARRVLSGAIGLRTPAGVWRFATDGGHFHEAGQTVVGFGPGDETLAHTVNEAVDVAALETALAGNRALALGWTASIADR